MITVRVDTSGLQPLFKRVASLRRDQTPLLRSMGTTLLSITKGNFSKQGASFRPHPWPAKRDGSDSRLKLQGTLYQSIRLDVTKQAATVSAAPVYAAIHQFGGVIKPKSKPLLRFRAGGRWFSAKQVTIPARPFFPIDRSGSLTRDAELLVFKAGQRALNRMLGI